MPPDVSLCPAKTLTRDLRNGHLGILRSNSFLFFMFLRSHSYSFFRSFTLPCTAPDWWPYTSRCAECSARKNTISIPAGDPEGTTGEGEMRPIQQRVYRESSGLRVTGRQCPPRACPGRGVRERV